MPEQHHRENSLCEHHADCRCAAAHGRRSRMGTAPGRGRIIVLSVQPPQRGENIGQAKGVVYARDFSQGRTGFDREHVGCPGREDDPLLRDGEFTVVQDIVRRRIVRGRMEKGIEIAGDRVGIAHRLAPCAPFFGDGFG